MSFLAKGDIEDYIDRGELIKLPHDGGDHESVDKNNINQSSYDLCLGKEIYMVGNAAPQILTKDMPYATLIPGQFAILTTHEIVSLPNELLAFISLKSTYKFQGLVNISGFHVDPTFEGKLRFGVQNVGPSDIRLKCGEPTFTIFFSTLSSDRTGKSRKDNGNTHFRPSKNGIRLQDVQLLGGGSLTLASLHNEVERLSTLVKIYGGLAIAALVALIVDLLQRMH
ncbi:dCTP deaminase [Silvibacterium acidisoli]|uniref:dCTP deaminase n=1 Tax=Acidobacteriaceae bacterium ZG23-2 TaxID=2883246 RepID=UPI00406D1F17